MRPSKLQSEGVTYYNGKKWTYFNTGIGIPALVVPGRHVDDNLVQDGDGYICLGSQDKTGTTYITPILDPYGKQYNGKVYEYSATAGNIDVFTYF